MAAAVPMREGARRIDLREAGKQARWRTVVASIATAEKVFERRCRHRARHREFRSGVFAQQSVHRTITGYKRGQAGEINLSFRQPQRSQFTGRYDP